MSHRLACAILTALALSSVLAWAAPVHSVTERLEYDGSQFKFSAGKRSEPLQLLQGMEVDSLEIEAYRASDADEPSQLVVEIDGQRVRTLSVGTDLRKFTLAVGHEIHSLSFYQPAKGDRPAIELRSVTLIGRPVLASEPAL